MNVIDFIERTQMREDIPNFKSGDTVRVHLKIREGEKERVQAFEGVCIRRHDNGARSTITVRKVSYGVGVERIFPLHSPRIVKIDVVTRNRVRRSRLYFLRSRRGKAARLKELRYDNKAASK